MMDYCLLGLDTREITNVASRFAAVSFLCAFDAVLKNNPEFGGKKKHEPVIPCALIALEFTLLEGQPLLILLYLTLLWSLNPARNYIRKNDSQKGLSWKYSSHGNSVFLFVSV